MLVSESVCPVLVSEQDGRDDSSLDHRSGSPPMSCVQFPRFQFKYLQIPRLVSEIFHHSIKLPLLRYREGIKVPSSKSSPFPGEEIAISVADTLEGIQPWPESGRANQFKETENGEPFCSSDRTIWAINLWCARSATNRW